MKLRHHTQLWSDKSPEAIYFMNSPVHALGKDCFKRVGAGTSYDVNKCAGVEDDLKEESVYGLSYELTGSP